MRNQVTLFITIFLIVFHNLSDGQESTSKWGANYFPDYELTNQDGNKERFFTDLIKDKIVLINFIYTSCPDTCPLETSRLREVYALLGKRMGKDIFFYSITIDPKIDTVSVLKEYAERWEVGPGWEFLTGNEDEIKDLRKKLGLLSVRDVVNLTDHQVNMIMGNQKTGRWIHRTPFDTPIVLAEHLGTWLNNYKNAKETWHDYADAPDLRKIDSGEYIFRTRCVSCHSIGGGESLAISPAFAGPDLLAIEKRREPGWLMRWIREPDVMIAEKDPLAIALLNQYKGVAMPNFRLGEKDTREVLAFIASETELHLNGQPTIVETMRATRISTDSTVHCPNCAKAAAAADQTSAPKKWERPQISGASAGTNLP